MSTPRFLCALLILSALFVLFPNHAAANRCTGTCGDGSVFDKPAATCDACRVLVCPRTCRIDGVTSCKWCNKDVTAHASFSMPVEGNLVIRRGPDPNDDRAPTGPVRLQGAGVQIPRLPFENNDGTLQIPIELLPMQLTGIAPVELGGGGVQFNALPPSGGLYQEVVPMQDFPLDSFFDVVYRIELQGHPPLHNLQPMRLYARLEATDPIAGENLNDAPVMWHCVSGPVPLFDDSNDVWGWVLGCDWIYHFVEREGPVPTEERSWGKVKASYR